MTHKLPSKRIIELYKEGCKKDGVDATGLYSLSYMFDAFFEYLDEQFKENEKVACCLTDGTPLFSHRNKYCKHFTPAPQEKIKQLGDKFGEKTGTYQPPIIPDKQDSWAEEFDKEFPQGLEFGVNTERVKSFISSAIAKREAEIIKMLEDYIESNKGKNPLPTIQEGIVREIISKIKNGNGNT